MINVSGHRLGTIAIESALVSHPAVAGPTDEVKGEDVFAFVTLEGNYQGSEALAAELKQQVAKEIGEIAPPVEIRFTDVLPKLIQGRNF